MRLPRGPHLASVTFGLVIVLAAGALAWGASHDGSAQHGFGSTDQQAAARRALATSLQLPAGLAFDRTFSSCGGTGDECVTGTAGIAGTLTSLGDAFRSAGGSLGHACATIAAQPSSTAGTLPTFTCTVEGRLDGAWVLVMLGEGWMLPGHPTPRTAALVVVESASADALTVTNAPLPSSPPNLAQLLPSGWTSVSQACAVAATGSASPTAPVTAASAVASASVAQPVLPACEAHSTTVTVSAPVAMMKAATQLAAVALTSGFRLDGTPCTDHPGFQGCQLVGERRHTDESGLLVNILVATLHDDGNGKTTGTVSMSDQNGQR